MQRIGSKRDSQAYETHQTETAEAIGIAFAPLEVQDMLDSMSGATIITLIEDHRGALERLCVKHHVRRFEVFGSAADGTFDPEKSDLDFLVEFDRSESLNAADQYFGLLFDLEALFRRRIDLVCAGAMWTTHYIRRVNESRKVLYAA